MKNEYVYNFTATSGLKIKNVEYGIEDKVNITFFSGKVFPHSFF